MHEFTAGSVCRTKSRYESAYPNPLKLNPGDRVMIGNRASEWPGWIWCTDEHGLSGWIPQRFLKSEGIKGVLLVEYDATELTVEAGESVEILGTESSWARCRTPEGRTGWLPLEVLEPAGQQ
jgi:uncharacterized protein YgiM (DUF1202 family)